ncbi:DUF1616 domain-containing protein [Halobaculum halobium]|uniref:DUF1616 domain-containing protein n=1 Tax=Halobaculum halobium TaxID=3032281 RepID=A0ABD5T5F9_9EURY|nr:DUF1616 domain-containing protein [Halobaculum sp. SYNS20]
MNAPRDLEPSPGRSTDLLVIVEVAVTMVLVVLVAIGAFTGLGGPTRTLLGGALVLFLPGYALSTLVFPASDDGRPGSVASGRAGLAFLERLAFAVGASVASVPVLAWAVALLGYPFDVATVLSAAATATGVLTVLGGVRRLFTPRRDRYVLPVKRALALASAGTEGSVVERASTAAFVVAVAFAVVAVTAGLVAPIEGDGFTQASILVEGDDGRQFVGQSPGEVPPGGTADLVVRVENHERESTDYIVVVQLQRVVDGEVVDRANADRFSRTVEAGETWERPHEVRPFDGENVRIAYLIYREGVPADPDIESAYRAVTVWTTVADAPGDPGPGADDLGGTGGGDGPAGDGTDIGGPADSDGAGGTNGIAGFDDVDGVPGGASP